MKGCSCLGQLLLHATCRGSTEQCHALLKEGADVNCRDRTNLTPLMVATLKNHVDIVKLLVEHGCDLNLTSNLGRTALHIAIWNKRTTVTCLLLRQVGPCSHNVNQQDRFSDTPLMMATWRGYTLLVKAILRASQCCDIHVTGPEGDTAMHYAARHGRPDCARVLHRTGADLERQNKWGHTPLYLAVIHGHTSTALELIRLGANVNAPDRMSAGTILHHAVRQNMASVVFELLVRGADLETEDLHGNRPLVEAILYSDCEVSALLVRANCDLNAPGSCRTAGGQIVNRCSPLEVAIHSNKLEVAQLLYQAGCDITELRHGVNVGGKFAGKMVDPEFTEWVSGVLYRPQSLANHCRRTLIKYLRTLPLGRVKKAAVPPGLVNYLNYGDVLILCKPMSMQTVCKVSHMQIRVRY